MSSLAKAPFRRISALVLLTCAVAFPFARPTERTEAARLTPCSTPLAQVRYIYRGLAVQAPHRVAVKGHVKQKLLNRYGVRTGANQRASVCFKDGSVLHINQRTDAVLRSPSLTVVNQGEVDQLVTPGSSHQVQTSAAVASAIGTQFDTRVKGKKSTFIVVEGAILVKAPSGSVVVKTGEETTVVKGHAPATPAPVDGAGQVKWTESIPPPAVPLGENIALDANGGHIIAGSSRRDAAHAESALIDGHFETGWQSAQGKVSGEWVEIGFGGAVNYTVRAVMLDCAPAAGGDPTTALHDFEIWTGLAGPEPASFHSVLRATCAAGNGVQRFDLPNPVQARYLEVVARSNAGSTDGVGFSELMVVGDGPPPVRPGDAPTPTPSAVPTPTLSPGAGGYIPGARGYQIQLLTWTVTDTAQDGTYIGSFEWDVTGHVCGDPYGSPWVGTGHWKFNPSPSTAAAAPPGTVWEGGSVSGWTVSPDGTVVGTTVASSGQSSSDVYRMNFSAGPPPIVSLHVTLTDPELSPHDQTVTAPLLPYDGCP